MVIKRLFRHLVYPRWWMLTAFPVKTRLAIEQAIVAAEARHSGQIRFVIELTLNIGQLWRGQTARQRAIDVFSMLRVWDTEDNSGVLVYVLLADRDVEIIADRGINKGVGSEEWGAICQRMEQGFAGGQYELAAVQGIEMIAEVLERHFPAQRNTRNELPDTPVIL